MLNGTTEGKQRGTHRRQQRRVHKFVGEATHARPHQAADGQLYGGLPRTRPDGIPAAFQRQAALAAHFGNSRHRPYLSAYVVKDMKENMQYRGYAATDTVIEWFWEVMETLDNS